MSEDMLAKIYEFADLIKEKDDNLLRAIASLAASGHMTVMPGSHMFGTKPVIMLPQNMYDRLCELFPAKPAEIVNKTDV